MDEGEYRKALKRRAELRALIEEDEYRVRGIATTLKRNQAELDRLIADIERAHKPVDQVANRGSFTSIETVAMEVIREAGHPLHRTELYDRLIERGWQPNAADPVKHMQTLLWRSKASIRRLEGFGYWLEGEPWEPAGYSGSQKRK